LAAAALTRRYVDEDLKSVYKGTLYYAGDAFARLAHNGQAGRRATVNRKRSPTRGSGGSGEAGSSEAAEDVEDLVGEEAKLGISKPRKAAWNNEDHGRYNAHDAF